MSIRDLERLFIGRTHLLDSLKVNPSSRMVGKIEEEVFEISVDPPYSPWLVDPFTQFAFGIFVV